MLSYLLQIETSDIHIVRIHSHKNQYFYWQRTLTRQRTNYLTPLIFRTQYRFKREWRKGGEMRNRFIGRNQEKEISIAELSKSQENISEHNRC